MRLLVFGSRIFPNPRGAGKRTLHLILSQLWAQQHTAGDPEFHIISGHSLDEEGKPCGPDWWAEQWANEFERVGVTRQIVSIDDVGGWNAHPGKRAAYVRNSALIEEGKPTDALGMISGASKGSTMMLELVRKVSPPIPYTVIPPSYVWGDPIIWK